ncbi:CBS domain protein [Rhodovulum imhoffii]|uniref:CBS domain protein n=1 Tax=Rhodovulum imhoffii TaxID=365340 RepID=A0A2T5BTZ1_9RHOB|nr:nucleotidyltransferase family protein [Rhodovulum imhoffii]MBK5932726.1 hypothetical protein [Rhodovulum imhoffii]PTN02932.1 CBS domain protein [Rhodovulum imhoffii]
MRLQSYTGDALAAATARANSTVREAMRIMSNAGLRSLPVTDDCGMLVGLAADGDIRRHLSGDGNLEDPISVACNRRPKTLDHALDPVALRSYMAKQGVESLPQVEEGRLVALHVLWIVADAGATTAVIMAGGLGTRLAPLTEHCPKPLLRVGDRPMLTHIIEHLRDQGVQRFVLSVNYLSGMIIDHYGDGQSLGVGIDYVHETMRMGTGGALGLIAPDLLSDPFLVLNGDLLNDLDVETLCQTHRSRGWDATMVVRQHHYTIPYGVVHSGPEGNFISAEEKPTFDYQINAGMYLLSKSVLPVVPKMKFYDLPTLFSDLSAHGLKGGTHVHPGRWIDIGNIADYERAQTIFERMPS